jgi:thioredoxin reductase
MNKMPAAHSKFDFDVAIVGGGPAGLSAAIVLGRSRRRVVLFDQGRPRNHAAQAVHCFLGHDAIEPPALREKGRREAEKYCVKLIDAEVVSARPLPAVGNRQTGFELQTTAKPFVVRALLLTTGIVDVLPDIPGFRDIYGSSVHHCPYCDGWEHRDEHLAALGIKKAPVDLAISLKTWSPHVTACTNGHTLSNEDRERLTDNQINVREEKVVSFNCQGGKLTEVIFNTGAPLPCDAVFFNAEQMQCSPLASMLGCKYDEAGKVQTKKKQRTQVEGLFVAGDADGEVQFAVVAAAEGATAAVAINALLQKQDEAERSAR